LLAVLAAHLPARVRVLELGTGTGAGTAWIVSALLPRTDVTVTTVEKDPQTATLAAQGAWPKSVDLRHGDALDLLPGLGTFDLIFADPQGGRQAVFPPGQEPARLIQAIPDRAGRQALLASQAPHSRSPVGLGHRPAS